MNLLFACWISYCAGFVSHIVLMGFKNLREEQEMQRHKEYLANLKPMTEEEFKIISQWAENNKRFNQECMRNQIRIVK